MKWKRKNVGFEMGRSDLSLVVIISF